MIVTHSTMVVVTRRFFQSSLHILQHTSYALYATYHPCLCSVPFLILVQNSTTTSTTMPTSIHAYNPSLTIIIACTLIRLIPSLCACDGYVKSPLHPFEHILCLFLGNVKEKKGNETGGKVSKVKRKRVAVGLRYA